VADLAADGASVVLDFLDLEEALERLSNVYPLSAQVVLGRFYAGRSTREMATEFEVSVSSVQRAWTFARAWLQERLEDTG